jgi:hypothetical protein
MENKASQEGKEVLLLLLDDVGYTVMKIANSGTPSNIAGGNDDDSIEAAAMMILFRKQQHCHIVKKVATEEVFDIVTTRRTHSVLETVPPHLNALPRNYYYLYPKFYRRKSTDYIIVRFQPKKHNYIRYHANFTHKHQLPRAIRRKKTVSSRAPVIGIRHTQRTMVDGEDHADAKRIEVCT